MEDIVKSIKAFLYDRAASPLFGAFVTAWCVWNYKVIAILLSDEKIADKFLKVDEVFNLKVSDFQIGGLAHGVIAPSIAAFAYIYLYPLIAKPVYEYSLRMQKDLKDIKQKKDSNRLLTEKESRELHKKMAELQIGFNKEAKNYSDRISGLEGIISENKEKLAGLSDQSNKIKDLETLIDNERKDAIKLKDELNKKIENYREQISDLERKARDLEDDLSTKKESTDELNLLRKDYNSKIEEMDKLRKQLQVELGSKTKLTDKTKKIRL